MLLEHLSGDESRYPGVEIAIGFALRNLAERASEPKAAKLHLEALFFFRSASDHYLKLGDYLLATGALTRVAQEYAAMDRPDEAREASRQAIASLKEQRARYIPSSQFDLERLSPADHETVADINLRIARALITTIEVANRTGLRDGEHREARQEPFRELPPPTKQELRQTMKELYTLTPLKDNFFAGVRALEKGFRILADQSRQRKAAKYHKAASFYRDIPEGAIRNLSSIQYWLENHDSGFISVQTGKGEAVAYAPLRPVCEEGMVVGYDLINDSEARRKLRRSVLGVIGFSKWGPAWTKADKLAMGSSVVIDYWRTY